jgi:predicted TIM-barrel fold metal-dependent hydrolase
MVEARTRMTAAEVRARVGHPIIDADGHVLEFMPALLEYVREEMGPERFGRFQRTAKAGPATSAAEKRDAYGFQAAWLHRAPAGQTLDLAAGYLPRLLVARMDDLGFDFMVLYGTSVARYARLVDDELRQAACRGANRFFAEVYGEFADRLTLAAVIPMHTPAEAVAELEHAKALGLKAIMFPAGVARPVPAIHRTNPELFPRVHWLDTYGLDSAYDYDPVWAKCRELGFAAAFHGGSTPAIETMTSRSVSNYMFNHIGSFAYQMHHVCKSLVMGGVTRRFPDLTFAFLEGGVGWASVLLADLIEHWEKRSGAAMALRAPDRLDPRRFRALHEEWGGELMAGRLSDDWLAGVLADDPPAERDEWRAMAVVDQRDFYDLFARSFYFGCEADDRTVSFGFSRANPIEADLNVMLGSDVGHWDVLDMEQVLPESYRLVQMGVLTPEQFRRFTFDHPANLYLRMNPGFFEGTKVAEEISA